MVSIKFHNTLRTEKYVKNVLLLIVINIFVFIILKKINHIIKKFHEDSDSTPNIDPTLHNLKHRCSELLHILNNQTTLKLSMIKEFETLNEKILVEINRIFSNLDSMQTKQYKMLEQLLKDYNFQHEVNPVEELDENLEVCDLIFMLRIIKII